MWELVRNCTIVKSMNYWRERERERERGVVVSKLAYLACLTYEGGMCVGRVGFGWKTLLLRLIR